MVSFIAASRAPAGPYPGRPERPDRYLTSMYPCISWCRALQKFVQ